MRQNKGNVLVALLIIILIVSAGIISHFYLTPKTVVPEKKEPTNFQPVRYDSKLVNLSFAISPGTKIIEQDFTKPGSQGKLVEFGDSSEFSFLAVEPQAQSTSIYIYDSIKGTLDSAKGFSVDHLSHQTVKQLAPDIYLIAGFTNVECSPSIWSFLLVKPPAQTELRYVSFSLGLDPNLLSFTPGEEIRICVPKDKVINEKINYIVNGQDKTIEAEILKKIAIAKSFSTSIYFSNLELPPIIRYLNYTSDKYGLSVKLPYDQNQAGKCGLNNYLVRENVNGNIATVLFYPTPDNNCPKDSIEFPYKYVLDVKKSESPDKVISSLSLLSFTPKIIHINGLTVIKYGEGGECVYPTLLVIGKKYNYRVAPGCGSDGSENSKEFDPLINIVKSLKLIN